MVAHSYNASTQLVAGGDRRLVNQWQSGIHSEFKLNLSYTVKPQKKIKKVIGHLLKVRSFQKPKEEFNQTKGIREDKWGWALSKYIIHVYEIVNNKLINLENIENNKFKWLESLKQNTSLQVPNENHMKSVYNTNRREDAS